MLTRILESVYSKPWAITPTGFDAVHKLLSSHLAGEYGRVRVEDDAESDLFGDPIPSMTMTASGIAIVPVRGPIARKIGLVGAACGGCDLVSVEANLDEAEENPEVRAVMLDIDSPGGSVAGVPELARRIREFPKPMYAATDGLMASAAYWLASQTQGIWATPSSEVGSIGVYLALIDSSKAFEDNGLKLELFKAGRLKGIGIDGSSLTPEMREHLQNSVDSLYGQFTSDVLFGRGSVQRDAMQGQTFDGETAREKKLVDVVMNRFSDALADINTLLEQ
jgi:signal peptide peptidase SppA